jgi:hypothetical protein
VRRSELSVRENTVSLSFIKITLSVIYWK